MARAHDYLIQVMAIRQQSAILAWHYFTKNFLGIETVVSYEVWQALERCDAARSFIYQWQKMCRTKGQVGLIIGLLDTQLSPTQFLPLIETLVTQQLLSRALANEVSGAVLARTNAQGTWIADPP